MNTLKNLFFALAAFLAMNLAYAGETPDLKAFMAERKQAIGASHGGYRTQSGGNVCQAMRSVGLGCSYNERGELTDFLLKNGVSLFPCKGNTNPYFNSKQPADSVGNCANRPPVDEDNYYIGTAQQNAILAASIDRNRHLFRGGNLTAANAKKWRL